MNDHNVAPNSTQSTDEVPPGHHVRDLLCGLYSEAKRLYEEDPDRRVEPLALTGYALTAGDRVLGMRDKIEAPVPAGEIKRPLRSSGMLKAFEGKGGVTECHVPDALLSRKSQDERYFENGQWNFRNNGPTIYRLGYLTEACYEECSAKLNGKPEDWAEAAEAIAEDDDHSKIGALSKNYARSPNRRSGRGSNRGSGRGSTGLPSSSSSPSCLGRGPNGCDTGEDKTADNRRSKRSDRRDRRGSKRSSPHLRHEPNRDEFKLRGTYSQREYLDAKVSLEAERLLFLHLLSKHLQASYQEGEDEGWITVPAEKMEQKMGAPYHATYRVWEDSDLIEAWENGMYIPPSETEDGAGKARMFRIPDQVLNDWLSKAGDETRRWWLQTPKPTRTSEPATMTCDLSDDNNNRPPKLVYKALKYWEGTTQPLNLDALDEALQALSERDWKAAQAQHASLQLAAQTIRQQADGEGETQLQNAYKAVFGGRIAFKMGGPQGMMSEVKAKAYEHVDKYTNWDIKSCHTSGLKQVADKMSEVGVEVDVSAWETYDGKDAVAERTSLPITLVKIVEHSIKYGAYLPASIAQARAVFEESPIDAEDLALVKAAKKYAEDPDVALSKLHDEFADMRAVVKEISEALLDEYYSAHQSGGYMHNACGVSFSPSNYDSAHKRRTQVMAWMLQGLEAAFIHSITLLLRGDDTPLEPLHNDHDGLGTKGEIDEEEMEDIQQKARLMSGFHRAELVPKAHASEDEIRELHGEQEDGEPADQEADGKAEGNTQAGAGAAESAAQKADQQPTDEEMSQVVQDYLDNRRKRQFEHKWGITEEQLRREHEREAQWREEHEVPDMEPA